MSIGTFLINEKNELIKLNEKPYESEKELQILLSKFPQLLNSNSSEENSELLLISREIGIGDNEASNSRWSLDHLFLDKEGIPVLVEVKRRSDTRLRREVVGQMLDYAANAIAYWPINHLQDAFSNECKSTGLDPSEQLDKFLSGSRSIEDFWILVNTNLQAGKIKMLFVSDHIPKELKRIIEFLNEHMPLIEVLGIEVKQLTDGNIKTISPVRYGNTEKADINKQVSIPRQKREDLEETVAIFKGLPNLGFQTSGRARDYRQVKTEDFSEALHYEFLHTPEMGITAEFHIESDEYMYIESTLLNLCKQFPTINDGELECIPWQKNRRRLRVKQKFESPEKTAKTMHELIQNTSDSIKKRIKK